MRFYTTVTLESFDEQSATFIGKWDEKLVLTRPEEPAELTIGMIFDLRYTSNTISCWKAPTIIHSLVFNAQLTDLAALSEQELLDGIAACFTKEK